MYSVDLYGRVRRACHVEGMSIREVARVSIMAHIVAVIWPRPPVSLAQLSAPSTHAARILLVGVLCLVLGSCATSGSPRISRRTASSFRCAENLLDSPPTGSPPPDLWARSSGPVGSARSLVAIAVSIPSSSSRGSFYRSRMSHRTLTHPNTDLGPGSWWAALCAIMVETGKSHLGNPG